MASILPIGIQPIPYAPNPGTKLNRVPVGLSNRPANNIGPNSVRLDINWANAPYSASTLNPVVAVEVDLLGQAVQQPLDQIRSVYIDNSNSIVPIYITFPDTNFLIQCPPRSVAWQPVLTGQQKAIILGVGFVSSLVPSTPVHFTNIDVAGYVIPIHGANLTRGQAFAGGAATIVGTTAPSVGGALFTQPPAAPDRLLIGIAACRSTVGPPTISLPEIGGNPAAIISQAFMASANLAIAMFGVLVPTGLLSSTISWATNQPVVDIAAAAWALYNYSDENPYWQGIINSGVAGLKTISPFVTEDAFNILGAARVIAAPVDTVWTNAVENGQFNTGQLEFSVATVDGGNDNYIPVTIDQTARVVAGAWQ